jgi:lysophospholipase L1-like esterase
VRKQKSLFQDWFFILSILSIIVLCVGWFSENQPRIFLIGDSTMSEKPLVDNPEHGWGQVFPLFFNENVKIFNHAKNGRSTKSYIDQGLWQIVVDRLQPGDYLFIQFGHNDAKKEDSLRYTPARPTYKNNLIQFIRETREKKAIPILLTPIVRRDFKEGQFVGTHGEYPAVVKEVATEEHVLLIDMFEKSKRLVSELGDEQSKMLYLAGVKKNEFRLWNGKRDNTHFTRSGAIRMASLVAEGMRELRLPLAQQLTDQQSQNLIGTGKVVGLDYFFNNEWRMNNDSVRERWHYVWEDTTNSGFSQLGKVIDLLGANLDTLQNAPTDSLLKHLSVYVLVDPDTPLETKSPNYMSQLAIDAIVPWVANGGVLVLMENDKGNSEFEHFNNLAARFGIHFNEDSYHKVVGKAYETAKNDHLPNHPIFEGVKQIFTKEVCSLKIEKPGEPILMENDLILMASARYGKGLIFAICDPWLYNEYMDTRRLPEEYENTKAGRNLFRWLLSNASVPIH